jgi:hypothetical protein
MAEARVPKVDTSGESEVVGGGGCRLDGILHRRGYHIGGGASEYDHASLTKKLTLSNSTVTELSRARHLTDTKF